MCAEDQTRFEGLPWAIQKAAGRPCFLKAAVDWHARRWWAAELFDYCALPESFKPGFFARLLRRLYIRYPDLSPFFELRRLDQEGPGIVRAYNSVFKQAMSTLVSRAGQYASGSSSIKRSAATIRANQQYIHGRARQSAVNVLYGMEHQEDVETRLNEIMDEKEKEDPDFDRVHARISLLSSVRSELFHAADPKVQKKFVNQAKSLPLDTDDPAVL